MTTKTSSVLIAGGLSLIATACVTTQGGHTYVDGHCITCLNNPITGQSYNYDKAQAGTGNTVTTGYANNRATQTVSDDQYVHGSGRFFIRLSMWIPPMVGSSANLDF